MYDKKYVIILSYNEVKQIKEYVLNNPICCILFVNGFNAVERPSTKENLEGIYKVSPYSSETYYIKEK